MSEVRRVLILAVRAGAGHLRAAQALEAALRQGHPGVEVHNVDALEYTNPAFRKSFSSGYEKLAGNLPSVWKYIYDQMERKEVNSKTQRLTAMFDRLNARPLADLVADFDPDAIICSHYMPAEILGPRRRKGKLRAPLYVVLTDYDIHTMWVQPGVDRYFVATEEMAYALRTKGIGEASISVAGIPIMPVFSQRFPDRAAMRRKLGLRSDAPTALVAAGGFEGAHAGKIVAALAEAADDAQLLAFSGRHEKLKATMEKVAAQHPGKVVAYGFVDNMHELMAASDFAITKSGGLTSSECLAMGLPMVIFNPIPGQEERNADYLLERGAALRANSAAHLVYKARRLLTEPDLRQRMSAAARQTARPRAAASIVAEVVGGR